MKYCVSALIAATAFAQFDPTNCCREVPIYPQCIGCVIEASPNGSMSPPDVTELVNGVVAGALGVAQVDATTCIKDIDPFVTHITNVDEDFKDGSNTSMTAAVKDLGLFFSEISTTMDGCGKISADDVTKLNNIADAFLNPKNLMVEKKSVMVNGVQLYNDMMAADYDFESE